MQYTDHTAWTDLAESSKFVVPSVLLTSSELASYGEAQPSSDLYLMGHQLRKVVYHDRANNEKYYMELMLYVHPVGAADIDLTTGEGKFILTDGTIATAVDLCDSVAGVLFSHYYSGTIDSQLGANAYRVSTLTAGDAIWVIRRGRTELLADAVVTADGHLVIDNATTATDGAVRLSIAIAATVPGIVENLSAPEGACVGISRAAAAAGALFDAEVTLPARYTRP